MFVQMVFVTEKKKGKKISLAKVVFFEKFCNASISIMLILITSKSKRVLMTQFHEFPNPLKA